MLTSFLKRIPLLQGLIDFVYPPICSGCGIYCEDEESICVDCLKRIDWWDAPLSLTDISFRPDRESDVGQQDTFPLFAAGGYSDPLQQIIIRYKFQGVTSPALLIARRIVEEFGDKIGQLAPASLVPIPLHPSREYLRGYNQATLFAGELSKLLDMPVDTGLLVRVKKRKPQSKLGKSKRAANIKSVFALTPEAVAPDRGERVILVDDVVTSGQTMFEARRVLAGAGCRVVGGIAMADAL